MLYSYRDNMIWNPEFSSIREVVSLNFTGSQQHLIFNLSSGNDGWMSLLCWRTSLNTSYIYKSVFDTKFTRKSAFQSFLLVTAEENTWPKTISHLKYRSPQVPKPPITNRSLILFKWHHTFKQASKNQAILLTNTARQGCWELPPGQHGTDPMLTAPLGL